VKIHLPKKATGAPLGQKKKVKVNVLAVSDEVKI
jgi:hypothetical protein